MESCDYPKDILEVSKTILLIPKKHPIYSRKYPNFYLHISKFKMYPEIVL